MFKKVVLMVAVLSRETGRNVVERNSLSVQHWTSPKGHDFLERYGLSWFLTSKSPESDVVSLVGRAGIDIGALADPRFNWRLAVRQCRDTDPP